MNINNEIKEYIEHNILPEYSNFDGGHDIRHINAVVERSFGYYNCLKDKYDLNQDMIYVVACYHDIGMKISRDNHATHSAELLMQDKNLQKWFSFAEIETMANAVEDHSTSSKNPPRSIYGQIVCDADKDIDAKICIIRAWEFSLKTYPNYTFKQRVEEIHKEIVRRFGDEKIGGKNLVKFYIQNAQNTKFLCDMRAYANDIELLKNDYISFKNQNKI